MHNKIFCLSILSQLKNVATLSPYILGIWELLNAFFCSTKWDYF